MKYLGFILIDVLNQKTFRAHQVADLLTSWTRENLPGFLMFGLKKVALVSGPSPNALLKLFSMSYKV